MLMSSRRANTSTCLEVARNFQENDKRTAEAVRFHSGQM